MFIVRGLPVLHEQKKYCIRESCIQVYSSARVAEVHIAAKFVEYFV